MDTLPRNGALRWFPFSSIALLVLLPAFWTTARNAAAADPFAVSTFHALGVYWSPPDGSPDRAVTVQYREPGAEKWRDALPLRYLPIDKTDEDAADYRGSIVNLMPNTKYEIRLAVQGTSTTANLTAATWSEDFPVGEVVKVPSGNQPLEITESGTPEAWRLYDGTGSTIDVRHEVDQCININASYVIVRGFTLKGAGKKTIKYSGPMGAIDLKDGHDILIERCDISDWGHPNKQPKMENQGGSYDSGVFSKSKSLRRVIIQRCKIHHPTYDSNHWYEPVNPTHPGGPQGITFFNSAGNHVFRYNEIYSDIDHMYNDILGGGSNGSYQGYPGPDSDIYCNYLSHCWDDAIEVEGGDRNVRVWNNYVTQVMTGLGNAPVSIGPLYFWRNIVAKTEWYPNGPPGKLVKMGFAGSEDWMTGHQYLFHNTAFQGDGLGCGEGIGGAKRVMRHTVTRNNILHLRAPEQAAISSNLRSPDNDFDYDLFNGSVPAGHEAHGIKGVPTYVSGAGFDFSTMKGDFKLAPSSAGIDAGEPIPNFDDGFAGKAPDIGADENGWPPMQFGVNAVFTPPVLSR